MQVRKIICSGCGETSYDERDFEFCVYCGAAMCYDCVEFEAEDCQDDPVCEECRD